MVSVVQPLMFIMIQVEQKRQLDCFESEGIFTGFLKADCDVLRLIFLG